MREKGIDRPGRLGGLAGLALAALLLSRPEAAAEGARRAMAQWYATVAPSLFPFMALMPLLTGEAAAQTYEGLLGAFTRRLFRLPGSAAPALAVGLLAGSPAGVAAARRVAARAGMSRGELWRLAVPICGFSPAFLLGGVGAGMLGSAALGAVLLRAQLLTQLTLLFLLRGAWRGETRPVPAPEAAAEAQPVRAAALAALTVCGYMALFGALAQALRALAGPAAGDALLCLLDAPSGARRVAELPLPEGWRLPLLAMVLGFGGACVAAQNYALLRPCGLGLGAFCALRLLAAALSAGFVLAQLRLPWQGLSAGVPRPLQLACLGAALLAAPVLVRLKKAVF